MAAAEARAAWQRAANRCFVQEDAKRAPKLAYGPSTMQQQEASNEKPTDSEDRPVYTYAPLNWNPVGEHGFSEDTKWWLQVQPTVSYKAHLIQKGVALDGYKTDKLGSTNEYRGEQNQVESVCVDPKTQEVTVQSPQMIFSAGLKRVSDPEGKEFAALTGNFQQPLKSVRSTVYSCFQDDEHTGMKHTGEHSAKKTMNSSCDISSPWEEGRTQKPWWRIADEGELALLVSQKAMEHFENCDLPKPTQKVHISNNPGSDFGSLNNGEFFPLPADHGLYPGVSDAIQNRSSNAETSWSSDEYEPSLEKDKPFSHHGHNQSEGDAQEGRPTSEHNPGRAQLLEALRHSQTRAREAEMAAKRALDEKEHIVKLLFRQASHLFAYKQWLKILQIENLCLQMKIKDQQIETLIPIFPWMPHKEKPSDKQETTGKSKTKNSLRDAVILAIGLGIAGAGLVLGWTLGWLLPKP